MTDETQTTPAPTPAAPEAGAPKRWYIVHTYSGHEMKAKQSLLERAKLLGHADMQSTARYAHLARGMEQIAAEKVGVSIDASLVTGAAV